MNMGARESIYKVHMGGRRQSITGTDIGVFGE